MGSPRKEKAGEHEIQAAEGRRDSHTAAHFYPQSVKFTT